MKTQETDRYRRWIDALKDRPAQIAIDTAVLRAAASDLALGDIKSVGDRVSELRVHRGPGYRIYFTTRGRTLMLLLIGGDKTRQRRDIAAAKQILRSLEEAGQW